VAEVLRFAVRTEYYKGVWIDPRVEVLDISEDGYAAELYPLRFIVTAGKEQDGKNWLHASVSRVDGMLPTYEDLSKLKEYCIGKDKTALQVFPPEKKHINLYQVLHLWHCLDGDVTPDFTRGGVTI
jgi:hypothetical protein